ncbi:hypothetical protein J3R83DRAFT_9102 [Lanmaoa asiatica]|nr:hypothetical protein J3R83DRAFT_9102 [Lanmaoa asiatica]
MHATLQLPCEHPGCNRWFKTPGGRTKHRLAAHPIISQPCRTPSPSLPQSPPMRPQSSLGSFPAENEDQNNPDQQWDEELRMGGTLRRVLHPYLNGKVVLFHI